MSKPRGLGWNLLSAAAYASAALACYAVFVLLAPGQLIDASALGANLLDMTMERQLEVFGVLRSGLIVVFSALTIVLGCAALFRGRWRVVVVTFVYSVVAVGSAALLRRLLWRPDLGVESYDYNTWPSTHVAAVCVLALACLRLAPQKPLWRWVLVVTGVVAVTVAAYASMASFAHRPSDTAGGILLAAAVFAVARPRHRGRFRLGWGKLVVLPAAAASTVLLVFPYSVSPSDPQSALALGALLGTFSAACWVLLPERYASDCDRCSRTSRAASS